MLEALMRNAGAPVRRERIDAVAWGVEGAGSPGRLEAQVSLLRAKLLAMDAPVVIRAIRGVGYVLEGKGAEDARRS